MLSLPTGDSGSVSGVRRAVATRAQLAGYIIVPHPDLYDTALSMASYACLVSSYLVLLRRLVEL